jgi:glycosyltransferase involved in cell wall biosynthesis
LRPKASVVIPVYNEGKRIVDCLDLIFQNVAFDCEVLVVFDSPDDTTVPYLEMYSGTDPRVIPVRNLYGTGPAKAIRSGIDRASADVVVVTMADKSDDPRQIEHLVRLVEERAVVAAASRYMPGGRQVGGPLLKGILSRFAGISLNVLARVGTRDATNSFKAYSTDFLRSVGIESDSGFEIGIELVAKARRMRLPVAEIPTTWVDRTEGQSNFRLSSWIPRYLRWYLFAFGRQLSADEIRGRAMARSL